MSTTTTQTAGDIANIELADLGKKRIDWANQSMKVLQIIRKEFIKNQPLKGMRISACLHVTAETANLAITLRDGGADVVLCASNPLSTQDDVAACLVRDYNIPVYAIKGEDNDTYYTHIMAALDHKPHITMDDGADLVTIALTKRKEVLEGVIAGTEENHDPAHWRPIPVYEKPMRRTAAGSSRLRASTMLGSAMASCTRAKSSQRNSSHSVSTTRTRAPATAS